MRRTSAKESFAAGSLLEQIMLSLNGKSGVVSRQIASSYPPSLRANGLLPVVEWRGLDQFPRQEFPGCQGAVGSMKPIT